MSVVSESIPFEPNFQPLQQLQRRPRRRRCRTWNFTSTIPIEERRQENLVKGEAVVCISKDHSMLMVMILTTYLQNAVRKKNSVKLDVQKKSTNFTKNIVELVYFFIRKAMIVVFTEK